MEEELQEEQESTSSEEEEHGSVWSRRKALSKMLPGREKQVQMLLELFGEVKTRQPLLLSFLVNPSAVRYVSSIFVCVWSYWSG